MVDTSSESFGQIRYEGEASGMAYPTTRNRHFPTIHRLAQLMSRYNEIIAKGMDKLYPGLSCVKSSLFSRESRRLLGTRATEGRACSVWNVEMLTFCFHVWCPGEFLSELPPPLVFHPLEAVLEPCARSAGFPHLHEWRHFGSGRSFIRKVTIGLGDIAFRWC